jgi:hypothetical protein
MRSGWLCLAVALELLARQAVGGAMASDSLGRWAQAAAPDGPTPCSDRVKAADEIDHELPV